MIGEWELPSNTIEININENKIIGHIIHRLQNLVYSMPPAEPLPIFPHFPLKITLLGKPFAGKTTALKQLQKSKHKYISIHTFYLKLKVKFLIFF
jgi:hypothetical protein